MSYDGALGVTTLLASLLASHTQGPLPLLLLPPCHAQSVSYDSALGVTTLVIDPPAQWDHLGVLREVEGKALDMRAEVSCCSLCCVLPG